MTRLGVMPASEWIRFTQLLREARENPKRVELIEQLRIQWCASLRFWHRR